MANLEVNIRVDEDGAQALFETIQPLIPQEQLKAHRIELHGLRVRDSGLVAFGTLRGRAAEFALDLNVTKRPPG